MAKVVSVRPARGGGVVVTLESTMEVIAYRIDRESAAVLCATGDYLDS